MDGMDDNNTVNYSLVDVGDTGAVQPISSTPGRRATTPLPYTGLVRTPEGEPSNFLESINFDEAGGSTNRRAKPAATRTDTRDQVLPINTSKKMQMKPGKFDGTGSFESFLTQFEVCARHNQWSAVDKIDFLRCALEKAATQLLWDYGSRTDVTYEELVDRLRQRYGAEGQSETFRTQLYYRRQRTDESMSDLLHDIRRLVVLAYPVPSSETTEIIARDAFLEALRDRELSLKVREREPRTLDEAYRIALRMDAYQRMRDPEDHRRPYNRIRGTQEVDINAQIQSQLSSFFDAQQASQKQWQQRMESKIERQLSELRIPSTQPTTANNENSFSGAQTRRRPPACYNCGRPGHFAREYRSRRPPNSNNSHEEPVGEAVVNHNTKHTTNGESKNAIYINGTINGNVQQCLIDTGSEVSLVPATIVNGLAWQRCTRTLFAANGTGVRVLGDTSFSQSPKRSGDQYNFPSF